MSTHSLLHSESAPSGRSSTLSYMGTALVAVEVAMVSVVLLFVFCPSTLRRWFSVTFDRYISTSSKSRRTFPPGPKGWPILGSLVHFGKGLEATLAEFARKFGGIVYFELAFTPVVLVTSSSVARIVLREQDSVFCDRPPPPAVVKQLTYLEDQIPFDDYGPRYTFRRKLMMLELLNQQKVTQFKHHRESEVDALVESIHHVNTVTASLSEAERAITLRPFLRACFMNALCVTAISQRLVNLPGEVPEDSSLVPCQASSAGEDMDNVVNLITSTLMISDFFPALGFLDSIFRQPLKKSIRRTFASMDAFLQHVVEQRRHLPREEEARDVLDILLSLRSTNEEGHEQPLTDTAVKAYVQLMILGGVDNTSAVVEWLLAELMRNPDCIVKMQEEMDTVVGKHRTVEEADLLKLPYVRAVIKEGMRLHPGGPLLLPRRCNKDTVVDGYHIAADTVVLVYVNAMQRDPAVWPDANEFRPERFLNWEGMDVNADRTSPEGKTSDLCPLDPVDECAQA
ncbi:hypothetical protein M758_9G056700 [Ceratodon purpureus]|nr:hypothetical protein M758_9G056700 [Ceratodon purpureus]